MSEDKSKLQLIGEIAQANNKNLELIEELKDKENEIERLHSIIKEVREYIERDRLYMSNGNVLSIANTGCGQDLLEILDKELKNKEEK